MVDNGNTLEVLVTIDDSDTNNQPWQGLRRYRRAQAQRILALIASFLEQGVLDGAREWTPEQGTPQGAVVSPLLSNIYLDPLDHLMAGRGFEMVAAAAAGGVLESGNGKSGLQGLFWTPIDAGSFALDPGLLYSIRFRAARQPPVEDDLPEHNARFAKPAALPETSFVAVADKSALAETLCVQEERVVGAEEGAGCGAVAAELLRENEGAVGNWPACHRHIRRIFARMSICSRVGLSPLDAADVPCPSTCRGAAPGPMPAV
jgi:hypothetical protein